MDAVTVKLLGRLEAAERAKADAERSTWSACDNLARAQVRLAEAERVVAERDADIQSMRVAAQIDLMDHRAEVERMRPAYEAVRKWGLARAARAEAVKTWPDDVTELEAFARTCDALSDSVEDVTDIADALAAGGSDDEG